MKLSIIIISYKAADILEQCLTSISYDKEYEIIVVDNENNPALMEKVGKYSKVKVVPFAGNLGFSKANNVGIALSKSELVMTLNADVFLTKEYIKKCVAFLDAHPDSSSVQGKLLLYNEPGRIDSTGTIITKSRLAYNRDHGAHDHLVPSGEVIGVCAAAAIYRRDALEDVKLFGEYFDDDFFAYLEDVDLDWRFRLKGHKAFFLHDATAFHIRESTTASKFRLQQALRNRVYMIVKNDSGKSVLVNVLLCAPLFLLLPKKKQNYRLLLTMFKKRRVIQSTRTVSHAQIGALLQNTPWKYYFHKLLSPKT